MEAMSVAVILMFGYFETVYSSNEPVKTLVYSLVGMAILSSFNSSFPPVG